MSEHKPNYNDEKYIREFDSGKEQYENAYGDSYYPPSQYADRGYTDTFYEEHEESGAGSFLVGAIVGGVIGAAAALFLAPKTGREMREDFSTQAVQLKEKGIELSTIAKDKATEYSSVAKDKASEYGSVAKDKATEFSSIAKDKATEFTSTAKEKTGEVTKTIQEQSEQLVDKVKSIKPKTSIPMDDGTASSEGEEAIAFVEMAEEKINEKLEDGQEVTTATAEAVKEAVVKNTSN